MNPATPMAVSTSSPSPASVPVGHQWREGRPILMKKTGNVRMAITAPPYPRARRDGKTHRHRHHDETADPHAPGFDQRREQQRPETDHHRESRRDHRTTG